ncbi:MBL fold metallo-hydrolase [Vulcanisaeta distributa]|uniref:MBL fold metallo-hydrolase n=1 Tax=Vulcanisaeta distributa TaxID=164451 RepID=UPI0006D09E35|nr:MBL fold metallo-hydrolase [Vulcanisaeta distributa]
MHKWEILLPGIPITTNLGFLGLCNVVLISLDDEYVIFDPGHYGNREPLLSTLRNKGLSVNDIDYVVLSHLHFDHAVNTLLFPKAKIIISRSEIEYARSNPNDPYLATYLIDLVRDRLIVVDEGDEILGAKFILLPGHTGGTMGLLLEDKTLLVGDAIKYVSEALSRRASFAYYNGELANESITKALSIAKVVVPGHDMPFIIDSGSIRSLLSEPFNLQLTLRGGRIKLTIINE